MPELVKLKSRTARINKSGGIKSRKYINTTDYAKKKGTEFIQNKRRIESLPPIARTVARIKNSILGR